ncbi:alpha/beta fold hydrolase [Massilia buxea]|uniref:Alpha/beta fold hydrolase n=2 Tax=Pseudoduganella buxea TaxID=1949069 RepID=A0A6I3T1K6_9BURK|nr:alpha/beta fold hydrolase [Pseudoduganella buxea]MTV55428.1 alpha/beta fold hydrolase [Pseudoduganella buxea]GGB85943.1 hypothetical protein GCM10011572_04900 [Pseudoduganella buxea]
MTPALPRLPRPRALALVPSFSLAVACLLAPGHAVAAGAANEIVAEVIAGQRIESVTIMNPDARACVVFENGSRATVDSWSKVIDPLRSSASIFAYNRPGYGNSQEAATPRDGATVVEELRRMLKQKGLAPPYILVGHSLGGLYMQLFARRYPDEVGGLVLVDSLYPGVIKKPEDFPLLTRGAKRLFFSATVNDEIDLIHQTGEQVLALGPIDDKPIVQLINRPTGAFAIPVDFGVMNHSKETTTLVRGLYPKATRLFLDSAHQMQQESPTEVVDAIKGVIAMLPSKN